MAEKTMFDTIIGWPHTALADPYRAGVDTTITLKDGSFLPVEENTATIWIADLSFLITVKYEERVSDVLQNVTVVEGYPLAALTYTYPVGSIMSKPVTHDDMQAIQDNIRDLYASKLGNKYAVSEAGKYLGINAAGNVVPMAGGGGGGSVYFSQILGQPTDNTNLNTALGNKVTKHEGTFEIGKDANGSYIWT